MIERIINAVSIAVLGLLVSAALVVVSEIGRAESTDTNGEEPALGIGAIHQRATKSGGGVLETSEVCFINDRHMGKPQIPVEVEGKTYYGCCAGCAETLQKERASRYSRDPLTGGEVDKATATIAEDPRGSGKVLYFESKQTYERYLASNR